MAKNQGRGVCVCVYVCMCMSMHVWEDDLYCKSKNVRDMVGLESPDAFWEVTSVVIYSFSPVLLQDWR